jgi:hypothetical protein
VLTDYSFSVRTLRFVVPRGEPEGMLAQVSQSVTECRQI